MNVLITGCNGQLGNEMRAGMDLHDDHQYFLTDVTAEDESLRLDITDKQAVLTFVQNHQIELIVNCAAYTNVDKAEEDEPTARKINCDAVRNLAEAAAEVGAKMIHVSTDYVFDGKGHYKFINYNPDAIITKGTYELDGKTLHVYYNTADAEGVITMNENIFELDDATNPTKLTTRVYDSFGQMVMTVELGKAK